jgi:hypothetical protein
MAIDWQALLQGATQNGAPLYNEQGNATGNNQWAAYDPTIGESNVIQDPQTGKRYVTYGANGAGGRSYVLQELDEAGNPVGEPRAVERGSAGGDFLKAAAPVAAVAAMPFAVSGLEGLFGGASGAGASGAAEGFGGAAAEVLGGSTAGYTPGIGLGGMGTGGATMGAATEPVSSSITGGSRGGLFDGLLKAGGIGSNVLPIAGGLLAAVDANRDKTQSSEVAPWSAAQPWMRDNITKGQALQAQYEANPFSPAEKTAYGNYAQLYNQVQQALPGLLAGYGANASGANNYDRMNPRRPLTGSNAFANAPQWAPGLLDFFPKG